MKNLRKNKKGFTLIEIIVVLVIMGVLLAIAVPSVLGYVNTAKDAKYIEQARAGYMGAQMIATEQKAAEDKLTSDTVDTHITKDAVNAKAGVTADDDGAVMAIKCTVTNNGSIEKCAIQVATDKYVNIVANKKGEIVDLEETDPDLTPAP